MQTQYTTHIRQITWRVPSSSRPGVTYTVTAGGWDGELRCSCPARGVCRHMRQVARQEAPPPRVRVTCRPAGGRARTRAEV